MTKTFLTLSLGLLLAGTAQAADIVPINADPPGSGLNDTTPIAPAGGNPGTTIGEQRRIVYQFAADLWGAVLESPAEIRVQASFQPLRCDSTGTVLGSAGTLPVYILTESGQPDTLYHGALSDALVGYDIQNGASVDIVSRFNSSYGGTNPDGTPCSPGSGWYYGLDGNTPAGLTNFLNVVMHEIAHGLGFSGFGNVTTGAPYAGYPDIYSRFVHDNNSQRDWYQLTNAGRVQAAVGGNLVFRGPNVTAQVPLVLGDKIVFRASGTVNADFGYEPASFGPEVTVDNFSGEVVVVNDGTAQPSLGCAASPAGAYAGKIALVDRGVCPFEIKVKNAENAGAIGVVVANNIEALVGMAGDPTVEATIPAVSVALSSGNAIKAGVPGVSVALVPIPGEIAGADAAGYARLYAPNPVQTGSSFSHYDVSASPNALMEPAITRSLAANIDVDLTPALFSDEGWTLNPGSAVIDDCNTGVDVVSEGGLIVGANVQAWDDLCFASTENKDQYQTCMAGYKNRLQTAGLVSSNQGGKVASCAARRKK